MRLYSIKQLLFGLCVWVGASQALAAERWLIEAQPGADIYMINIADYAVELETLAIINQSKMHLPFLLSSSEPQGEIDQLFYLPQGGRPYQVIIDQDIEHDADGFQSAGVISLLQQANAIGLSIGTATLLPVEVVAQNSMPQEDLDRITNWSKGFALGLLMLVLIFFGYWFLRIAKR